TRAAPARRSARESTGRPFRGAEASASVPDSAPSAPRPGGGGGDSALARGAALPHRTPPACSGPRPAVSARTAGGDRPRREAGRGREKAAPPGPEENGRG